LEERALSYVLVLLIAGSQETPQRAIDDGPDPVVERTAQRGIPLLQAREQRAIVDTQ
jgi:hypothetical protein